MRTCALASFLSEFSVLEATAIEQGRDGGSSLPSVCVRACMCGVMLYRQFVDCAPKRLATYLTLLT